MDDYTYMAIILMLLACILLQATFYAGERRTLIKAIIAKNVTEFASADEEVQAPQNVRSVNAMRRNIKEQNDMIAQKYNV